MNLSIFNFRNNTEDIKKIVSKRNICLFLFIFLFVELMIRIIYDGFIDILVVLESSALAFLFALYKQLRLTFIVVLCGGIGFLIFGELYFRISYFGVDSIKHFKDYVPAGIGDPLTSLEYDDDVYTGLKTGSKGILLGGVFEVNNLGFRDNNRYYEKENDAFRVVVCGTSISMGAGVNQGENYPAYLENMLNEEYSNKNIEVINLSVGGYQMSDMVDVLSKYGIKFDPDIVIIEDRAWLSKELYSKEKYRGSNLKRALNNPAEVLFFFHAIKNEFSFHSFVSDILELKKYIRKIVGQKIYEEKKSVKNYLIEDTGEAYKPTPKIKAPHLKKDEMVKYYLKQIRKIVSGKKVYIVTLRQMRHLDRHVPENKFLKENVLSHGLDYISTLDEDYGANDREMIIYLGNRHPNAKAHRIYAEAIFKAIKPYCDLSLQ